MRKKPVRSLSLEALVKYGFRPSQARPVGFIRRYSIGLVLLTLVTLAGMVVTFIGSTSYNWNAPLPFSYNGLFVVIFSAGADVYYAVVAVTSINREMAQGQWALLRLTTMTERDIIQGKYIVSQLHARHVMSAVRLVNLCYVVIENIPTLWPQLLHRSMNINGLDYPDYLPGYLPIVLWVLLLQVYWRPVWTMRLMVATSLLISASIRHVWSSVFVGLAVVPLLHLATFYGMAILSVVIGEALYYGLSGVDSLLRDLIGECLGVLGEYIAYRLLTAWSLRLTRSRAFKLQQIPLPT